MAAPVLSREDLRKIVTPLQANVWEHKLKYHSLYMDFQDIPSSIQNGFDMGVPSPITHTYIPHNHASALQNPCAADAHLASKLSAGHISGPFEPAKLETLIGPFRASLLGTVPKDDRFRVIQDLLQNNLTHPVVNNNILVVNYPCGWDPAAKMILQVMDTPNRSKGATLDIDAVFRQCPVCPDQQQYFVIAWCSKVYLDHCAAFGGRSACGVFGRLAGTFVAICCHCGFGPCLKWVDDFAFIRLGTPLGQQPYQLKEVIQLGVQLGLPFKATKTRPFAPSFTYVGFKWSFLQRTIVIPAAKKTKYLKWLAKWVPGVQVSQHNTEQLLGTFVHCLLAMPDRQSHLVVIIRLAAAFGSAHSQFSHWKPSPHVLEDIIFWRAQLSMDFCGSVLQALLAPVATQFFVNTLTGWSIGVVFNSAWESWCLCLGWHAETRDIG
jgi:hypothetical protein